MFGKPSVSARFFYNITSPQGLCVSPTGHDVSHSGYIGLKGDTEDHPKRSFFWYVLIRRIQYSRSYGEHRDVGSLKLNRMLRTLQ